MDAITELQYSHPNLSGLVVALLLGLLIGIQRGWRQRERRAGERVAGVRTYTLTGIFGALSELASRSVGDWLMGVALLCLTLIAVAGFWQRAAEDRRFGITGLLSLLLTFVFGALAMAGHFAITACAAVFTALILDNKDEIHGLLLKLEEKELDAALKLLLISVVLLPILPNEGFGPGGSLNPYEIWWMVVLIASISFAGYFAMRIGGARKGILFTGLFAGLSSSTALSLHYARLSRQAQPLSPLLAVGILIACGTMFPRVLLLAAIFHPPLALVLAPPLLVAVAVLYALAAWVWHRHGAKSSEASFSPQEHQNPLDLKSALFIGTVLVVVLALTELVRSWLGNAGIYLLAAATGLSDVNPIVLSFARMTGDALQLEVAAGGILLAALTNSLVKVVLASFMGHQLHRYLLLPMGLALAAGAGTVFLW